MTTTRTPRKSSSRETAEVESPDVAAKVESTDIATKVASRVAAKKAKVVARDPARRKLTDPKVMRALAHPLRIALLDALLREGPLTATAAANILDDSPGNMSWHLNVLAKYGFVEEVEDTPGRSRPWRLVNLGTEFNDDDDDDPELVLAGETFSRVIQDRNNERAQRWIDERRSYPPKWRKAGFSSSTTTYLTAEELTDVGHEITAIFDRYRDRSYDIELRPEGSRAVSIVSFGHPLPATTST